jgi:hypothetical protein
MAIKNRGSLFSHTPVYNGSPREMPEATERKIPPSETRDISDEVTMNAHTGKASASVTIDQIVRPRGRAVVISAFNTAKD